MSSRAICASAKGVSTGVTKRYSSLQIVSAASRPPMGPHSGNLSDTFFAWIAG